MGLTKKLKLHYIQVCVGGGGGGDVIVAGINVCVRLEKLHEKCENMFESQGLPCMHHTHHMPHVLPSTRQKISE